MALSPAERAAVEQAAQEWLATPEGQAYVDEVTAAQLDAMLEAEGYGEPDPFAYDEAPDYSAADTEALISHALDQALAPYAGILGAAQASAPSSSAPYFAPGLIPDGNGRLATAAEKEDARAAGIPDEIIDLHQGWLAAGYSNDQLIAAFAAAGGTEELAVALEQDQAQVAQEQAQQQLWQLEGQIRDAAGDRSLSEREVSEIIEVANGLAADPAFKSELRREHGDDVQASHAALIEKAVWAVSPSGGNEVEAGEKFQVKATAADARAAGVSEAEREQAREQAERDEAERQERYKGKDEFEVGKDWLERRRVVQELVESAHGRELTDSELADAMRAEGFKLGEVMDMVRPEKLLRAAIEEMGLSPEEAAPLADAMRAELSEPQSPSEAIEAVEAVEQEVGE